MTELSPTARQHGLRDTDPWAYGNRSLAAIESIIKLRSSMEPFIMQAMSDVSACRSTARCGSISARCERLEGHDELHVRQEHARLPCHRGQRHQRCVLSADADSGQDVEAFLLEEELPGRSE